MCIRDLLILGMEKLIEYNIDEYTLKAKMLLCDILKVKKEYLIINDLEEVDSFREQEFFRKIDLLCIEEPIQYIIGKQEFMGLEFNVNKSVLIPQPDTEILVEKVIEIIKRENKEISVLDLCTGSGAIGISIKKLTDNTTVTASDISLRALRVARENAEKLEVDVNFIESDLFENINSKFDIIVSNPPYIKSEIIEKLPEEVKKEPIIALDGGVDGLEFYKNIINNCEIFLNEKGFLCLEIGYDQKEDLEKLIEATGKFENVEILRDFGGNYRVIICNLK